MKLHDFFQHLKQAGLGYLPFKLMEGLIGILSLALYTRLFSTETYGYFMLINSNAILIGLICIGWLRFVFVRYVKEADTPDKKTTFYSSIVLTYLAILVLGLIAFLISLYLIAPDLNMSYLIFYLLFFIGYTLNQLFIDLLIFTDQVKYNVLLLFTISLCRPILIYSLYLAGLPPRVVMITAYGLIDVICSLVALHLLDIRHYVRRQAFDRHLVYEFIHYGFPLIGLTLTMYLLNVSDRYLIDYFYSKSNVGIYTANYAISSAFFTLVTLGLSRSFYPRLLQEWKDKQMDAVALTLQRGIKNYLLLGLPAAIGLTFIAFPLADLLTQDNYLSGYPVIGITAFGMFFFGLSEYFNKGHELTKKAIHITINATIATLLNIILNLIFIPLFGFLAAATTTLFSFFVYSIICYLKREKSIPIGLDFYFIVKWLLANAIMFLILFGLVRLGTYFQFSNLLSLVSLIGGGLISYGLALIIIFQRIPLTFPFMKNNSK